MAVFCPHAIQLLRQHSVERLEDLPSHARAELDEMARTLWPELDEASKYLSRMDESSPTIFTEVPLVGYIQIHCRDTAGAIAERCAQATSLS